MPSSKCSKKGCSCSYIYTRDSIQKELNKSWKRYSTHMIKKTGQQPPTWAFPEYEKNFKKGFMSRCKKELKILNSKKNKTRKSK